MGSYNVGAINSAYPTGFNAKPRKAKEENEEKEALLGKDFQNEYFNGWNVAGLTGIGAVTGFLGEVAHGATCGKNRLPVGVVGGSITGIALAGGLLWEKLRSDGAKKHNTELLEKLRSEENN
jgi:hypothetical protein